MCIEKASGRTRVRLSFPFQKLRLATLEAAGSGTHVPQEHLHLANGQKAREVVPTRHPTPGPLCCLSGRSARHVQLLLLAFGGLPAGGQLPVDQAESAEDEEHASPPQDFLALSIQHKAQEGLRDRDRGEVTATSARRT